jgi:hypothetical protein
VEIRLDERGLALPDNYMEDFIKGKIQAGKDIHVSNELAWNYARAAVQRIPLGSRPEITWFSYGEVRYMDDDVRCLNWHKEDYTMKPLWELL